MKRKISGRQRKAHVEQWTATNTLYFILCQKFFLNRGRVGENKEMRRIGKNVITKTQTEWNKR